MKDNKQELLVPHSVCMSHCGSMFFSCQVVKVLGSHAYLVHKELLSLLQDDALEVRAYPRRHCSINACLISSDVTENEKHQQLFCFSAV